MLSQRLEFPLSAPSIPEQRSTLLTFPRNFYRKLTLWDLFLGIKVIYIMNVIYEQQKKDSTKVGNNKYQKGMKIEVSLLIIIGLFARTWPYNNMLNLFKPKPHRKVTNLLQQFGFYSDDFRTYQIQLLAQSFVEQHRFIILFQILREIKITPIRTLKIVLLCQQLLHCLKEPSAKQKLFQFLHELQIRIQFTLRGISVAKTNNNVQVMGTSVQIINNYEEPVAMNFTSIIMGKIVVPLIHFQLKIIVSTDIAYSTLNESGEQCWLRINLLRKIVDIGSDVESLGRYYFKQSQHLVVAMMNVLNVDIQILYKRIFAFCRKKIVSIEIILGEQHKDTQKVMKQQKIQEFLMMIEELQFLNQKLRTLYNGRYFVFLFAKINVFIPVLFTGDQHIQLLYKMKAFQSKKNRSVERRKKCHRQYGELVQQI